MIPESPVTLDRNTHLAKTHIQRPVQCVLHRPVAAHRVGDGLGPYTQGQAADVVVGVFCSLPIHLARAPHHSEGLQLGPVFGGPFEVLRDFDEPIFAARPLPGWNSVEPRHLIQQ